MRFVELGSIPLPFTLAEVGDRAAAQNSHVPY
jgi:hypothetical protein